MLVQPGEPMVAAESFTVRAGVPDGNGGWTAGASATQFPAGTYLVYRSPPSPATPSPATRPTQ